MDRERIKRRREAVKPRDEKKRMRRGGKKRRKACKFGGAQEDTMATGSLNYIQIFYFLEIRRENLVLW